MAVLIQFRRGTAASWASTNPVLAAGELGLETDTALFKIGDGSTAWTSLSYGGFDGTATLSQIGINGGTDIGAAIADGDEFVVYDLSASTNKKAAASRIPTYVFGKVSGDITVGSDGTSAIGSGVIVNADVNSSAAIAHSKLANATAGQVLLGTTTTGVVTATTLSGDVTIDGAGVTAIASGAIVNADINASAAVALSKLASGTSAQVIVADASGVPTYRTLSGDITISNAGVVTIEANSVALGTDTTGNYVASLVAGTGITLTNNTGEGATPTVALTVEDDQLVLSGTIFG